jgi:flagellar biosynthesis GTPase FlhF
MIGRGEGGGGGGRGARFASFVQDVVMAAHPSESFDFQETCAKEVNARYSDFMDRWFVLHGDQNAPGSKGKRQPRKKAAAKQNTTKKRAKKQTQLKVTDLFRDACEAAVEKKLAKKRKRSDEERAKGEQEAKRAKAFDEEEQERKRDEAQRAEYHEKQEREEKEYQKQLQISLKYGFKPQPRKKRAAILLDQEPEKYRYDTAHL